ncbi:TPA: hypothetical protein R5237_000603 [Enterobacter kobei]|nr:hypothetical protein [Enterobacter kobei]
MSVKRYEWMACDEHGCHCDVVESAEGDMVDYEDYAALEHNLAESQCEFRAADATIENLQMQLEKMAAENAGLKGALNKIALTYPLSPHIHGMTTIKTPATDAFLAEVRAQGVEMLVKHCEQKALEKSYDFFMDAGAVAAQFAAQLRQEAQ